jgi:SAM-dependent methyltransferase
MFPFMFPESSFGTAAENVSKIAALSGVSTGNVLDLACGPGRYAIPLAQAGYVVTAVDRTPFLLDSARQRATRLGANIEWVEQDMREFVRPAAFDLALNVFTSFGYFDDEAENRRVLENVYASLKPGGPLCSITWVRKFSRPAISRRVPSRRPTARSSSTASG